MRTKILKVIVVLLLSGSGEARPQKIEEPSPSPVLPSNSKPEEWRTAVREDSRPRSNDTRRNLKDLQYMDQSLRTVATQLLNVSNAEEPAKVLDNAIKKPGPIKKPNDAIAVKEIPASNGQSVSVAFRPINSKFNFFETSHPGQAMAITEEELEKEMSSTRLMTAHKHQPTTTGGISTWILLNPPSTTMKTLEVEKKTKEPSESEVKMTLKPTTLMERIDTTERVAEKATMPVSTTIAPEETATTRKSVPATTRKPAEMKLEKIQGAEKIETPQSTTQKTPQTTMARVESKETASATTKKVSIARTTPKPKTATTKTTVLSKNAASKPSRPNQQTRPKVSIRRTTVKPDLVKNENASTAKIEKVTFRPVQMITTSKSKVDSTEKPMFVTKIKASILMDTQAQKATTQSAVSSTTSTPLTTISTTTGTIKDSAEVTAKPKPGGTKVNNVLKVQLKKPPLGDHSNIEIQPMKTNAPVLKVEKLENEVAKEEEAEKESASLSNSRIDLMKFDFNPELTKINVNTEVKESSSSSTTEASTTASASSTTSTKRPRNNSKRKKNKLRRRRPSTSTTTSTVAPAPASSTDNELMADEAVAENGIQESKIVPETKVSTNLTKIKKKPGTNPGFSTQIYNFLSREVMPSFGVMSLVGLGLGLASYFLYPFGGTVTRRNYELEPKYKYSFDEYGGNYGQTEEEVLSKVLQGMTTDDNKYPGTKNYDKNYYRYQHYDGGYEAQTTKKPSDTRYPASSAAIYRPESTNSVLKYKNTDYRYPEVPSTPNYYDRPKHTEYVVGQTVPGSVNRQFVVGNVPKEYSSYNKEIPALSTPGKLANSYEPTESGQVQFDHGINQNFNLPLGSVQNYGQIQTARPEETYEEVEITPTAVAVEHGPRSLKLERSSAVESLSSRMQHSRRKRDSVIQVIPSKRALEEETKEEDLSNEILDIIDSALPGDEDYDYMKRKNKEKNREPGEDFEGQRRKNKEEEERIRLKQATMTSQALETSTAASSLLDTSSMSVTKEIIGSSTTSTGAEHVDASTSTAKTTEESTVDWIDPTTKKPAEQNGFSLFNFVKKVAEIKFRLGLTLLKHASEGFARYLGHVQKRINGEE